MILVAVTSEDVCWSIRNVMFINESFYNMRCLVMFVTAICVLFLLKLNWPKNKSVYDLVYFVLYSNSVYLFCNVYKSSQIRVTKSSRLNFISCT